MPSREPAGEHDAIRQVDGVHHVQGGGARDTGAVGAGIQHVKAVFEVRFDGHGTSLARAFHRRACGLEWNADVNGARNILARARAYMVRTGAAVTRPGGE